MVDGSLVHRNSVAVAYRVGVPCTSAWIEDHTVVGIKLQGMGEAGYVSAYDDGTWDITPPYGNVTMALCAAVKNPGPPP